MRLAWLARTFLMRLDACVVTLAALLCAAPLPAEPPAGHESLEIRKSIEYYRSLGHGKVITALAYTPDSKILAAAAQDGTVRLWNADATKLLRTLQTSSLEVYAIAISPDGKLLASAGSWSEIQVWEIATGKELHVLKGHNGQVPAVTFSTDGKLLASGGYDKTIRLWDTESWREKLKIAEGLDRITSLSFSPGGKTLASGGAQTSPWRGILAGQADFVRLWDVDSGKLKKQLNIRGSQVAFAPDGRSVMASGLVLWVAGADDKGGAIEINGLALGGSAGIRWYDPELNLILLDTTRKSLGSVFSHSPDWNWFACTEGFLTSKHLDENVISSDKPDPLGVRVWEGATRKTAFGLPSHYQQAKDYETITAFSFDGRCLAVASFHGALSVRALALGDKGAFQSRIKNSVGSSTDLWQELASEDAEPAFAAICQLQKQPEQSVKLLAAHLRPAPADAVNSLKQPLETLAGRDFKLRQEARAQLRRDGWLVMPLLRTALEQAAAAETRRQLTDLLVELLKGPIPAASLRETRAIYVLERIGTGEARATLRRLAQGPAGASLTEMAQSALKRLGE